MTGFDSTDFPKYAFAISSHTLKGNLLVPLDDGLSRDGNTFLGVVYHTMHIDGRVSVLATGLSEGNENCG